MITYLLNKIFSNNDPKIADNIFGKLKCCRSKEGNFWAGFIQNSFYNLSFELFIRADEPVLNDRHKMYYQVLFDNWRSIITEIRFATLRN